MRPVVIHYHIYKNAGTSVDECLRANFGDRWSALESDDNSLLQVDALQEFIVANPDVDAISSHTAQIVLPKLPDVIPIPIVFLRHPIDRIRSVYDFERADRTSLAPSARYAQTGNFEDYYIWRLTSFTPWQITNFQSFKFKDFFEPIAPMESFRFRENCIKAIDNLGHVGLVEHFDRSMKIFENRIRVYFPEFTYRFLHKNGAATREKSLEMRLNRFRNEIGPKLYLNLVNLNSVDLECVRGAQSSLLEE